MTARRFATKPKPVMRKLPREVPVLDEDTMFPATTSERPAASTSWWVNTSREELSKRAQAEIPRMAQSKASAILTTDQGRGERS